MRTGIAGGPQQAIEAAEHGEGEDDAAILGLLVIAAQEIGDGPDEIGQGLVVQGVCPPLVRWCAGWGARGQEVAVWAARAQGTSCDEKFRPEIAKFPVFFESDYKNM